MRTAFKDWAVIVEALGAGKQILIFRKGGIREARGGFKVEHNHFLLFPTLFHQQKEDLVDSAKEFYSQIERSLHTPEIIPIQYHCSVADWRELRHADDALKFKGQHFWSDSVIQERFDWGRDKGIYVMAVRVFRLPSALQVPLLPEYGGCKSWVQLQQEIETKNSQPVLDDQTHQRQLEIFQKTLPGP